jgi:hypothetical protein
MTDSTANTMTVTWTLELSEPLTQMEKDTIIGNLWDHIGNECSAEVPGFAKVTGVTVPAKQMERLSPILARRGKPSLRIALNSARQIPRLD